MSDWQVGDLAVCVDARDNPHYRATELVEGQTYRVAMLTPPAPCYLYPGRTPGLILHGVNCDCPAGFAAERFRKILPDKHEACEEEFVTLLNRTKRKVGA